MAEIYQVHRTNRGLSMKDHLAEHELRPQETNLFKVAETVSWIAAFQLYPPFDVT